MAFVKNVRSAYKKSGLKKTYRKVRGMAKKRYGGVGGRSNIVKDVALLKSLVNVEKKRFDVTSAGPITMGQTAGAGVSAYLCNDVTPAPPQGLTNATRNGNSIKIVSAVIDMYLNQSVNTINAIKLKWMLVCRPDNSLDIAAGVANTYIHETNPFSGVIDYHSNRDAEFFTAFKIIKSGRVSLSQDQIATGIAYAQIKAPLKLNHHLKYNTNASILTTKNKFYLIVMADTGDTVALTGNQVQYNIRWYYTDN